VASLKNLTIEQLTASLEAAQTEQSRLATRVKEQDRRILTLITLKARTESDARSKAQEAQELSARLFLKQCLPAEVVQLRERIFNLLAQVASDQITVAEQRRLSEELKTTRKSLQLDVCNHRLVVYEEAYSGSRSNDYDDASKEVRVCVVCGLEECQWKAEEFKVLQDTPHRLIRRYYDFYEFGSRLGFTGVRDRLLKLRDLDALLDLMAGLVKLTD